MSPLSRSLKSRYRRSVFATERILYKPFKRWVRDHVREGDPDAITWCFNKGYRPR